MKKTLIGVLASRDEARPNRRIAGVLTQIHDTDRHKLEQFHFVFTGGTYDRVFFGQEQHPILPALRRDVAEWLHRACGVTRLPATQDGGVIVLSYMVSQRICSIVWPFYAPNAHHWQRNENLAFTRLCDQWHVKRLMNTGSVLAWYDHEASHDANRNLQPCPPQLELQGLDGRIPLPLPPIETRKRYEGDLMDAPLPMVPDPKPIDALSIALIAHDQMKSRMIDFAIDHEPELNQFHTVLATGTTGREVAAATSQLHKKIVRYHSGPKGGDIEIATAILFKRCDVVIFFVDPLNPHPHIEDIRTVFQACMVSDHVLMITNEMHAREFMARVVRGKTHLNMYQPMSTAHAAAL